MQPKPEPLILALVRSLGPCTARELWTYLRAMWGEARAKKAEDRATIPLPEDMPGTEAELSDELARLETLGDVRQVADGWLYVYRPVVDPRPKQMELFA